MTITRRTFLRSLASGLLVAAVPEVLVPERRFWQVGRNAPVGRRVSRGFNAWYDASVYPVIVRANPPSLFGVVMPNAATGDPVVTSPRGDFQFAAENVPPIGTVISNPDENGSVWVQLHGQSFEGAESVTIGGEPVGYDGYALFNADAQPLASYSNTFTSTTLTRESLRAAGERMRELMNAPLRPDPPLICSPQFAAELDEWAKEDPEIASMFRRA